MLVFLYFCVIVKWVIKMEQHLDDIVKVHRSVICGEDMQTTYLFPTLRIVRVLSVSYTHLDVYKRQV